MHALFPAWLLFVALTLLFWGITGVTQKLSTDEISSELSFLWFAIAMVAITVVIIVAQPVHWHVQIWIFWMAAAGGTLNGLGALTSFAAFEKGGKASVVIPLIALYPLLTVLFAVVFLHESLTRLQMFGIALAVVAAILLSQEPAKGPAEAGLLEGAVAFPAEE